MAASGASPHVREFIPEQFCDEVYDYVDDNLAEAMDEMERELHEITLQEKLSHLTVTPEESFNFILRTTTLLERAAKLGADKSLEEAIKTACDKVQQRHQREFDRNLDIFDRYVKKNLKAAMPDSKRPTAAAPTGEEMKHRGGSKAESSKAEKREAAGDGDGAQLTDSDGDKAWNFEVDEKTPPKRVEDERKLDAELQGLRVRRRETLRRRAALKQKRARVAAVLQDVNKFVEGLQMGVSSSFDDNGLTPVPAKVKEAVDSSAELRTITARAQDLTKQIGERHGDPTEVTAIGKLRSAGAASSSPTPRPHDLQAVFERSQEQQIMAGDMADYSALHSRLKD